MKRKSTFFLIAVLFFVIPVAVLFIQSFTSPGGFAGVQLDSWGILFSDPHLWSATFWSIGIGAFVLLLNFLIGISSGRALALNSFKFHSAIEALLLAPILIPVLLAAMGLHLFMIRIGLADTWIGVSLVHLVPTIPYSNKIFRNAYNQVDKKLMEQSEILGAAPFRQFITIELPLLKAAIRSVTFLTIVISLSQYAITAIIGGGIVITLPMIFFPYLDSANDSVMSAFALWFAIPPLIIYLIIESLLLLIPYSRKPWRQRT
ncbi:ABC transporter permease [Halobacillus sp. Marseille-Q1614]|uniref:ABC transporter permease n=1 Tax=Halobacillus sp. Marseille-Q1614 TaxID=2709134 RepID=UPI00156FD7F9|nr:ABC transporter permease subunit [Halobacillus sp. Marseille-Q1614]